MASNWFINVKQLYLCLFIFLQISFGAGYDHDVFAVKSRKKVKLRSQDVINATEKQIGTVYFFHTVAFTGENAKYQVLTAMPNFSFPHLKVAFPTAPEEVYLAWEGQDERVWFNELEIGLTNIPEDPYSSRYMAERFKVLLDAEVKSGIPLNKIIFGGFSHGGGFALHLGYSHFREVAGIFSMSYYLLQNSSVYANLSNYRGRLPPLLMTHSAADEDIPFYWGHLTYQKLIDHRVNASLFIEENSIHEITTKQAHKVYQWILSIIPIPQS